MVYLKRLSPKDGLEIYEMLQEILPNDNGFHNKVCGATFDEYRIWLNNEYEVDNGRLEDWMVPQSSFWLYDGNIPVGYGRIRHKLNENLEKTSGHIGYAIRRTFRQRGYGNKILKLLLDECKKIGLVSIQISANENNIPSNKVILNNGGKFTRLENGKNFYKIEI